MKNKQINIDSNAGDDNDKGKMLRKAARSMNSVDKVQGGARLGFISVGDGETQVMVYIDCKIFPPNESSALPLFRATRNGLMKDKVAPGEPRIMRSLLQALQKSAQIARV